MPLPTLLPVRVSGAQAWATFGSGGEAWNTCRTATYLTNGVRPGGGATITPACPTENFNLLIGDSAYTYPDDDLAPWYDPAFPVSAGFAGFLPTDITGLDVAPFERDVTERTGHGSVLGRGRVRAREIVVRGLILGMTCSAVDYGFNWLKRVLAGTPCDGPCVGDDFTWLSCVPCDADGDVDVDSEFRTLRDVALLSGPEVLRKLPTGASCSGGCSARGGCYTLEVEFILVAGVPFAHHKPLPVVENEALVSCEEGGCSNIEWVLGCVPAASCLDDLACSDNLLPPVRWSLRGCAACEPFEVTTSCFDLPPQGGSMPATVIFSVTAGSTKLRNVIVRFYLNPAGQDPSLFSPDQAFAGFAISEVPAGSTVTVDGTAQQVTLLCDGDVYDGAVLVEGLFGVSTWRELGCGTTPVSGCLTVDCSTVDTGAMYSISVVGRDR